MEYSVKELVNKITTNPENRSQLSHLSSTHIYFKPVTFRCWQKMQKKKDSLRSDTIPHKNSNNEANVHWAHLHLHKTE